MKVVSEREVDIELTLSELKKKAEISKIGKAGYETMVDKQLLQNAYDIIFTLTNTKCHSSGQLDLYAIKDNDTGDIIMNARSGFYKDLDAAIRKVDKLNYLYSGRYELVTYKFVKTE